MRRFAVLSLVTVVLVVVLPGAAAGLTENGSTTTEAPGNGDATGTDRPGTAAAESTVATDVSPRGFTLGAALLAVLVGGGYRYMTR